MNHYWAQFSDEINDMYGMKETEHDIDQDFYYEEQIMHEDDKHHLFIKD